jgi:hypothetical protein
MLVAAVPAVVIVAVVGLALLPVIVLIWWLDRRLPPVQGQDAS